MDYFRIFFIEIDLIEKVKSDKGFWCFLEWKDGVIELLKKYKMLSNRNKFFI